MSGLDRPWLLASLPHRGAMNLLEAIASWDAASVHAIATSHRAPDNPLRRDGRLPSTAAIEYGAQAAAAHGALIGESGAGMLASVRGVRLLVSRLDEVEGTLEVTAEQLGGSAAGVLYRFEVAAGGTTLVDGRVTIAFAR